MNAKLQKAHSSWSTTKLHLWGSSPLQETTGRGCRKGGTSLMNAVQREGKFLCSALPPRLYWQRTEMFSWHGCSAPVAAWKACWGNGSMAIPTCWGHGSGPTEQRQRLSQGFLLSTKAPLHLSQGKWEGSEWLQVSKTYWEVKGFQSACRNRQGQRKSAGVGLRQCLRTSDGGQIFLPFSWEMFLSNRRTKAPQKCERGRGEGKFVRAHRKNKQYHKVNGDPS